MSDELSETLVLNFQTSNTDQNNSIATASMIQNNFFPIKLGDLSYWNLYLGSFTLSSVNIPIRNFVRNLGWDGTQHPVTDNFALNRTNLAMSLNLILVPSGGGLSGAYDGIHNQNPTTGDDVTYELLEFPQTIVANKTSQVVCYCQYNSENANPTSYPNPTLPYNLYGYTPYTYVANPDFINSVSYPRRYWNLHSVDQFMDMLNVNLQYMCQTIFDPVTNAPIFGSTGEAFPYFSYVAQSDGNGTYQFFCGDKFKNGYDVTGGKVLIDFTVNNYVRYFLDGFRWQVINDNGSLISDYPYLANDNVLILSDNPIYIKTTTPELTYLYPSSYASVRNLVDITAIVISAGNDLANVRTQYYPYLYASSLQSITQNLSAGGTTDYPNNNFLLSLDFNFSSLNVSINNSSIQFEAPILDRALNFVGGIDISQVFFNFFYVTIDNLIIPIELPAGEGFGGVKLFAKKRVIASTRYRK